MNFAFPQGIDLPIIDPQDYLESHTVSGLYHLDIATGKMTWSHGIYKVLNLNPEEVTPSRKAIRDLVHPRDRRPIDEMDRTFSSGIPFRIEHRIITRDRRVRWVSNDGEFLWNSAGEATTVVGIIRDISALRQARDLVSDYSQRLDTLLRLRTAVAWTAAPDGSFTSVPDWETAFGAPEEPLGAKVFDIIHPDDRERTKQEWASAVADGEKYVSEHRMMSAEKDYRWRRCSALPIKAENGSIREWLGITVDIHDEKTGNSIRGGYASTTGAQIRAARSLVRLSVRDLAEKSDVPIGTIRRIEDIDGVSAADLDICNLLRKILEHSGVTFLFPAGMKPAVCPT